jgi:hypothetical protein
MENKPSYITNFVKPANTEIKHINGHWYLYERKNVYDPEIKRSRKKSGKCLGSITEDGLVSSKDRRAKSVTLNDVVEAGAVSYFYQSSEDMRLRLQKYFPELWERIYAMVLLRTIYDPRFRRLQLNYEDSILSHLYPNLSFSAPATTAFLKVLGRQREAIRNYMRETVEEHSRFILFDGHRLLSASRTMDNAELGYDSKMRYKPQINLLYMFSLGVNTGRPVYYKQYIGSTPDVIAFADILTESGTHGKDCTVIADKAFDSEKDFGLLEKCGLYYVIPLKRGNRFVRDRVPSSPADYEEAFSFNGRGIQSVTFHEDGFNIHLFLDTSLLAEEVADLTKRTEKHNRSAELAKDKELKRRERGKGRLTDDELKELEPLKVKDVYTNRQEMGTITLKTNRTDLNSFQIYSIYKQRQAIEQFFKTYSDTMEQEASYMRNNYSEEAWLFLNHLSSVLCVDAIEHIASIGESKNISFKDFTQSLIKIKATLSGDTWSVFPVKRSVQALCQKLNIDYVSLKALGL